MKELSEAAIENGTTTTLPRDDEKLPEIGQWYWVDEDALRIALARREDTEPDDDEDDEDESLIAVNRPRWLGAVTFVGSNYVSVEGFVGDKYGSSRTRRIHLDIFDSVCSLEPDAETIISGYAARHTANARELMGEVMELDRRCSIPIRRGGFGSLPDSPPR